MNKGLCVIIPAVKKNVAFPDDLIKKLGGVPLVLRAMRLAHAVAGPENTRVVTDSEEISLLCERNATPFFRKADLRLGGEGLLYDMRFFLMRVYKRYERVLILSPYLPLLTAQDLEDAQAAFEDAYEKNGTEVMLSVRREPYRVFCEESPSLDAFLLSDSKDNHLAEVRGFVLFASSLIAALTKDPPQSPRAAPFVLDERIVEIRNYQDWWVCEKLLARRRIIFRVIGNTGAGMGHIYRALALAHEVTDHEVIFVCSQEDSLAVNAIAGNDYLVHVFAEDEMAERIIALAPDLVVNDMLSTTADYITALKQAGAAVANFEDLGDGAPLADLTINELFDHPVLEGESILWGSEHYFLRDEFVTATPRAFHEDVRRLLITFGGTDQLDLSRRVLDRVLPLCLERGIGVHIVCGGGYAHMETMVRHIETLPPGAVEFTHATGVMSRIMEACDIAITSNGRTVYELCQMNVPSVVIAQNERETTHNFSTEDNGFLYQGIYEGEATLDRVAAAFTRLVTDKALRRRLHGHMVARDFTGNKERVVRRVLSLMQRDAGQDIRPRRRPRAVE